MKIKDFISRSIQEYPLLYKNIDYEKSKLKVLSHIFFTNGNGMEMAKTDNEKEGGYVVNPKYKKDKFGDYIRVKDKPYGKDKFKAIPDSYFDDIVYYVSSMDRPLEVTYKKGGEDKIYFRYDKKVEEGVFKPSLYEAKSTRSFSPYPISKGFCIALNIFFDNLFLQDDWIQELIILSEETLKYFKDENRYIENCYYPTETKIKSDVKRFEEIFKKEGINGLNKLQKIWGYTVKDTVPDYAEVEKRKNKSWKNFHKEQIKFLNMILEKYNK